MGNPTKVTMHETVSPIPYVAYDENDKLVGYADDAWGPIVLDSSQRTLAEPIQVKVLRVETLDD